MVWGSELDKRTCECREERDAFRLKTQSRSNTYTRSASSLLLKCLPPLRSCPTSQESAEAGTAWGLLSREALWGSVRRGLCAFSAGLGANHLQRDGAVARLPRSRLQSRLSGKSEASAGGVKDTERKPCSANPPPSPPPPAGTPRDGPGGTQASPRRPPVSAHAAAPRPRRRDSWQAREVFLPLDPESPL